MMRTWFLKFMGFVLWSAFLFAPLIARADSGFDIHVPLPFSIQEHKADKSTGMLAGFDLGLGYQPVAQDGSDDAGWDLKLNARKDTVLTNDVNYNTKHDRIPLDDGNRESFILGVRMSYSLN